MESDKKFVKLAITIPAYNEEKNIGRVIREIPKRIEGIDEIEIIVINDGSNDRTSEAAKEAGANRIISHSNNKGVGRAFSTGLNAAIETGADIIVNIDADRQFNPEDIPKLIEPILKNEAEFVTASRFLDKDLEPEIPYIKKIGNQLFTWVISEITGQYFTDTQCGFRAFSRKAALKLNLFGKFTYTQEVFLDLVNKDITIKEIPIWVSYDKNRKSRVVKNPLLYGIKALSIIIRTVRDTKPLFFFGNFGLFFLLTGFLIGAWLILRWWITGYVSPYTSMVNLSALLLIVGFILCVLALIADMLSRNRKIQEEVLYFNKMQLYKNGLEKNREKNI
ncbi:MAG TPA: glycosyltransferase [Candidatus Methylomirabilis sp.]|nr:glycosyltransferase [Candidatus Methylomirabilis sp.]